MPAASSSRPAKRARRHEPADVDFDDPDPAANASHLVSFLTGYDTQRTRDEEHDDDSEDEGEARDHGRDDEDDDADFDDPDEDDVEATPTKRGKQGLVGNATPRSGRSTPRSTPSKPRKTPTPRKVKLQVADDDTQRDAGFIRPSKADAYFLAASRSSRTSGNSYSALVKPLSQAEYELHASSARSLGKSRAIVENLQKHFEGRFSQWELELEEGFNLLFYGFGSKRRLLNRFATDRLSRQGHCVVVNGHFPQIGIRDILSQIEDTLSIPQELPVPPSANTPLERSAHRIYAHFLPPEAISPGKRKSQPTAEQPLFLVIHNIDSPFLRTSRSLGILSLLASSPRIHLVASFDHLHTPLLFSSSISNSPPHTYEPGGWMGQAPPSRGFNWIYHCVTTYDDYDLELSYQRLSASSTSLAGIGSGPPGTISEEAALQILRSVPPMAARLLKLLLAKQLQSLPKDTKAHTAHPSSQTAPLFAVDNDILQTLSREKFIAREEERYNALLGEFRDHGLVVEAGLDGEGRTGRWVWVPLGKAALERVLETMSEVEV